MKTEVGNLLAALRKKVDMSQQDFADSIGTSRFTINQIERGNRTLTASMAMKIADSFNETPIEWLYAAARDALKKEIENASR